VTDLSFNHYAFGCVDDWMYRRLGGLQATAPGFRRSRIEPAFTSGLDDVSATIETPYGPLRCEWHRRGDRVEVEIHVPSNTASTIVLPAVAGSVVDADGRPVEPGAYDEVPLAPGVARFVFTSAVAE
jgi:alpha-L-rhamnosidase